MSNTLLAFTATWCNPCKQMKPILDSLEEHDIVRYDADENRDMFDYYMIRAVPVFLVLDPDGKEVDRIVGSTTLERLTQNL